jgi:uncharacterized protein (DUF1499 family)
MLGRAQVGLAVGFATALLLAGGPTMGRGKRDVPAIHDISTDTVNPPDFVDVLPRRRWALNPPEYDGPMAAAQQREAYGDIVPLRLSAPRDRVHEAARQVMVEEGWEIVGDSRRDGRLEAIAITPWLRFRDDVVVRLTDEAGGTRVDMRSKSRLGASDLGTNARRVRRFLARLREVLGESAPDVQAP